MIILKIFISVFWANELMDELETKGNHHHCHSVEKKCFWLSRIVIEPEKLLSLFLTTCMHYR